MIGQASETVDLTLLLTVYRRNNLSEQLKAVAAQSVRPARVVIFQNGSHQALPAEEITRAGAEVVRNSTNTKFFGRFAFLLTARTHFVAVMDDDVLPGPKCIESFIAQAVSLDGIIGGNGRIALSNPCKQQLLKPPDVGIRALPIQVDFVGHLWLFKQSLLHDMFSIKPHTLDTGEDMHLSFSSRLISGVGSYAGAQLNQEQLSDTALNSLAKDGYASYRRSPGRRRRLVEKHFEKLGHRFLRPAEQEFSIERCRTDRGWQI